MKQLQRKSVSPAANDPSNMHAVKILKIQTPEKKNAVIILKFEQGDFTIETFVQMMQTEWQTV